MPGLRYMFVVASGAMLLAGNAFAADPFTLNSSSFKDGTLLPKKMAGDNKANPNCVGENVSPALEWKNPPAGTVSYALIMTDPEGRGGLGVDHWHAYGIHASVHATRCAPPLYIHHRGDRSRSESAPTRSDQVGTAGKTQRSHQRRRGHGRPVPQPLLTIY